MMGMKDPPGARRALAERITYGSGIFQPRDRDAVVNNVRR
jgi:hypothetical protein